VFFENIKITSNEYNYHYAEYTPIEGEMIMFESWLEHSVDMNLSPENPLNGHLINFELNTEWHRIESQPGVVLPRYMQRLIWLA
jgi:hypothetical protein